MSRGGQGGLLEGGDADPEWSLLWLGNPHCTTPQGTLCIVLHVKQHGGSNLIKLANACPVPGAILSALQMSAYLFLTVMEGGGPCDKPAFQCGGKLSSF